MTGQTNLQREIRLQLLRAADRLRTAASQLDDAIECMDQGDPWLERATDARIDANVAADQLAMARGMSMVGAMVSPPFERAAS